MSLSDWLTTTVPNLEQRPYQLEAWEALINARKHGDKRALIQLATGLGKTLVAAVDALHYTESHPSARVLFVVHMTDIARQARQTFETVHDTKHWNYRPGQSPKDVPLTFATFQGLYTSLDKLPPDYYDYIIWDEAHHIEATTFKAVREHFTPRFELGLTATPARGDGRDILKYFGEPVYTKSLADGMAEGWLSPVDYHLVFDDTLKTAIKDNFNVDSIKKLRELFQVKVRDHQIAQEVAKRRESIGLKDAKTIVFCHGISHAQEVAKLLGGEAYHADLKAAQKDDILTRFRSGHLSVICTVDMFNEGIDIPDARLVVFLRSTSSRTIFEQQLGRGLRRSPGKPHVTVLDFVANIERINFVSELGRHINRAEDAHQREGGDTRNKKTLQFNFGTSFEFDDVAIKLLDRYTALKARKQLTTAEVVAKYQELGKINLVAKHFDVSWNAVKKHLAQAGLYEFSHMNTRTIPTENIIAKFHELKTVGGVAKFYGMNVSTVRERMQRAGVPYTTYSKATGGATPEMIALYQRTASIKAVVEQCGVSRWQAWRWLKDAGVYNAQLAKGRETATQVLGVYQRNGRSVGKVCTELGMNRTKVYYWLDKAEKLGVTV
jgi:superfamily II DNA or RNA helicase